MDLMVAIRRCTDDTVTLTTVSLVRTKLASFLRYYEERYYRMEYDRLPVCLPVFHQVAHVADYLDIIGPMWVYSQWVMERLCGMIVQYAQNRFCANRNMEINLLLQEQRNLIPYFQFRVRKTPANNEDLIDRSEVDPDERDPDDPAIQDEDEDGNVHLYEFFMSLVSEGKERHEGAVEPVSLIGPSKKLVITSQLSIAIRAYRVAQCDPRLIRSLEPVSNPLSWAACKYTIGSRTFKVVSSHRQRENSTRVASYVRLKGGFFGEVKFFFSVDYDNEYHELAYVKRWKVESDEKLALRSAGGRGDTHHIFKAGDVLELVGLVRKDERFYIVRENMPVFIA